MLYFVVFWNPENHEHHLNQQSHDTYEYWHKHTLKRIEFEDFAPKQVPRKKSKEHERNEAKAKSDCKLRVLFVVPLLEVFSISKTCYSASQLLVFSSINYLFASFDNDFIFFLSLCTLLLGLRIDLVLLDKCREWSLIEVNHILSGLADVDHACFRVLQLDAFFWL